MCSLCQVCGVFFKNFLLVPFGFSCFRMFGAKVSQVEGFRRGGVLEFAAVWEFRGFRAPMGA